MSYLTLSIMPSQIVFIFAPYCIITCISITRPSSLEVTLMPFLADDFLSSDARPSAVLLVAIPTTP